MPGVSPEPPEQTREEVAKIYAVSTPGSQLFAAITACVRNSCGRASPCCVPPCRGAQMGRYVLEPGVGEGALKKSPPLPWIAAAPAGRGSGMR